MSYDLLGQILEWNMVLGGRYKWQMTIIMLTTKSTTNTDATKTGWEGAPVGTAEDPRPKLCHCVLTGARTQNSILLHTESLCQKMRPALLLTMEMWQIKSARASLNYECWHKNDKMLSAPAPAVTLPPPCQPIYRYRSGVFSAKNNSILQHLSLNKDQ